MSDLVKAKFELDIMSKSHDSLINEVKDLNTIKASLIKQKELINLAKDSLEIQLEEALTQNEMMTDKIQLIKKVKDSTHKELQNEIVERDEKLNDFKKIIKQALDDKI